MSIPRGLNHLYVNWTRLLRHTASLTWRCRAGLGRCSTLLSWSPTTIPSWFIQNKVSSSCACTNLFSKGSRKNNSSTNCQAIKASNLFFLIAFIPPPLSIALPLMEENFCSFPKVRLCLFNLHLSGSGHLTFAYYRIHTKFKYSSSLITREKENTSSRSDKIPFAVPLLLSLPSSLSISLSLFLSVSLSLSLSLSLPLFFSFSLYISALR